MATYYVDPENGNDANNGTAEATPWRLIPGQTGANAVSANDIINIKNGTTSTGGAIATTASGLTYRGYGVASNVLWIRVPGKNPAEVVHMKIVRSAGTHEGMWKLYVPDLSSAIGFSVGNSHSNVVVEDMHIINNSSSGALVRIGSTTQDNANGGFTMRRCFIEGSGNTGIQCYKFNPTIEYVKVKNSLDDNIKITSTATNSDRSGSTDIIRYVDLTFPNYNYLGQPSTLGGGGDFIQGVPTSGTGVYLGKINFSYIYGEKGVGYPGIAAKQGILIRDGQNGAVLDHVHMKGRDPGTQIGILLGSVRGPTIIKNIYMSGYNELQAIRVNPNDVIGGQTLHTGATLTIKNVVVNGQYGSCFFSCGDAELDGTINIENCTVLGTPLSLYSFDADVSLQGTGATFGANFKLNLRNNIFNTTWVKLRMPTGTANDADYVVKTNWFKPNNSFYIGSTEYTSVSTFQSAHNAATGNIDSALDINLSSLVPTSSTSAQVGTGTHTEYTSDIQGVARYNPPCIGAYELIR